MTPAFTPISFPLTASAAALSDDTESHDEAGHDGRVPEVIWSGNRG